MAMILAITDARNETANALVSVLNGMGVRWARFNRAEFPERAAMAFDPSRPGDGFLVDEDGDRIPLAEVASTWVWHPEAFRVGPGLPPAQARFLTRACRCAYGSLLAFLEERSFMVNPGSREARANDKGLQLRLARGLGLQVPDTLVTNDPGQARGFCARHPEVIFKVLNPPRMRDGDQMAWFSTRLLAPEDLDALDGIRHGPGIFQNRVPKRFDLRVTLVGDRVFPVEIHSQTDPACAVDFRRAWAHGIDLPHRVHDLPGRVRAQCLDLARALGLVYCAMDLVVTPDGEYVFLEVNPSGQYGWIEAATGLPITRALAERLAGGPP
jgi:glutathione synthase/RimK-type ligase-like ATP-grasp enzyme